MSLARRHFRRVAAAQAAADTDPGQPVNANAYELVLLKLAEDQRKLRSQQSIERRIEMKRTMLPEYAPWVDGVLKTGRGGQDAVLMTVMIWRIDVGDYAGALQIAGYALPNNLAMPDQYHRDAATAVAEEIADRALAGAGTGESFDLAVLLETELLTRNRDMPDQVRAKLHKALGNSGADVAGDTPYDADRYRAAETALTHYRRAIQLHDRVGVKKDIERLERHLKNSPTPHAAEPAGADDAELKPSAAPAPATHTDDEKAVPGNAAADVSVAAKSSAPSSP